MLELEIIELQQGQARQTLEFLDQFLYNGPKTQGEYDWRDALNFTSNLLDDIKRYMEVRTTIFNKTSYLEVDISCVSSNDQLLFL